MGSTAHFFFYFFGFMAMPLLKLADVLERTLPPLGYELVDWEHSARSGLVRVFIDKPGGVDVEDCAQVSTHLTHLLAAEQIDYDRLEVSSPGLDRPLKKAADFARFSGEEVRLTLREAIDNARRLKGILRGIEGDTVRLDTETGPRSIALANIDRARLVPKIEWRNAR
jgi:ribosome maturation factor RimP